MNHSASQTLRGLTKSKTKLEESFSRFMGQVKQRRASITPENVRIALSHRRLVRCLNVDGLVMNDVEDVEKLGPVVKFELTRRANP